VRRCYLVAPKESQQRAASIHSAEAFCLFVCLLIYCLYAWLCVCSLSAREILTTVYINISKQSIFGASTRKQNKSLIAPNAIRARSKNDPLWHRGQPTHTHNDGIWWKSDAVERQTRAIPSLAPRFMADADNCFLIWIRVAGLSISSANPSRWWIYGLPTPAPWLNIYTPRAFIHAIYHAAHESKINSNMNLTSSALITGRDLVMASPTSERWLQNLYIWNEIIYASLFS